MQITLKLPADTNNIPFQKEYSAAFRFAYERVKEGLLEKDIRPLIKNRWSNNLNNSKNLNSWMAQCAIKSAIQEYKAHKTQKRKKVIWGSKDTLRKLHNKQITKDEWKKARLRPVVIQGEALQKSNRLFDFSNLKNN